jgi:hypothetical protein
MVPPAARRRAAGRALGLTSRADAPATSLTYLVGRIGKSAEELAAKGITLAAIESEW